MQAERCSSFAGRGKGRDPSGPRLSASALTKVCGRFTGVSGTIEIAGRPGQSIADLNATPQQGAENLPQWAAFRLRFLRSDDATSARLDAATRSVRFRGGTGSCVVDDYLTKIGAHHYKELACLVQGHRGASVIVAAALAERWAKAGPLLERAVAAYQVR